VGSGTIWLGVELKMNEAGVDSRVALPEANTSVAVVVCAETLLLFARPLLLVLWLVLSRWGDA
jgi:hypothetical protein